MSNFDSAFAWMTEYLDILPRTNDPIFTQVWQHNRFSFQDQGTRVDEIDQWSARLVCAAMHENQRLLIVLPDRAPHRSALLFASCLVMDALDAIRDPDIEPNKVVYFGTTIGIREQLGAVKVHDLALDHVFPAYRTLRKTSEAVALNRKRGPRLQRQSRTLVTTLPQVVCVYAPADPKYIIDQFEPTWLAVDCSDTSSVRWLPSLLRYAEHLDLPVVAWSQSPLAATVQDFIQAGGLVFHWPKSQSYEILSGQHDYKEHSTDIIPIVIDAQNSTISAHLQRAYIALVEVTRATKADDRLLRDVVNIGWRYLQALELLPIPLPLYEAEIHRFWGATSLTQLGQTFARFVDAVKDAYPQVILSLQSAYEALSSIHATFTTTEPPFWTTLMNLCISKDKTTIHHLIVFSTEYRRQLFSFALLSRHNVTEHELQARGIWLTTLKTWYREYAHNERIRWGGTTVSSTEAMRLPLDQPYLPILVGLPTRRQSVMIEPLLGQSVGHVLIHPYQQFILLRRIEEWNAAVMPHTNEQAIPLARLAGKTIPLSVPTQANPRLQAVVSEVLPVKSHPLPSVEPIAPWQSLNAAQELARLFEDDEDDEVRGGKKISETLTETLGGVDDAWTDTAIVLQLEGGWRATFAMNDTVQVVVGTKDAHTEERYVRSLRQNDRILFIVGQRRQNLYDLIITRVHAHPAIELHLAMIRRWHEELVHCFGIWKKQQGTNIDHLLRALQAQGSRLTSTQTLRLWLGGDVLCPEDASDLQRLARILQMPFVHDNYRHIDKAAQRLRSIHRALARRLNRWLQQEATGALYEGKPDTFVLDKELGLTFSDFRDSLLILRVESVQQHQGLFLRSSFERLEREVAS